MTVRQSTPPAAPAPRCAHCGAAAESEPTRITIRHVSVRLELGGPSRVDERGRTATFTCRTCRRGTRLALVPTFSAGV